MSIKLLILIIDSEQEEIYKFAKNIWETNLKISNSKVFYLNTTNEITDDKVYLKNKHLYSKHHSSMNYRIIDKTLKAFKYSLVHEDFDFILRTNLSSFFDIVSLINYLNDSPTTNFYSGSIEYFPYNLNNINTYLSFCSGSGFIVSKDLVERLVHDKESCPIDFPDDVWIASRLINIERKPFSRIDFCDITTINSDSFSSIQSKINYGILINNFHFRVKNNNTNRFIVDSFILSSLLNRLVGWNSIIK